MNLLTNSLIQFSEPAPSKEIPNEGIFRIVYMDPSECVLFNINAFSVDPITFTSMEIEKAINTGNAKIIRGDPYAERRLISDHLMPEVIKRKRDFAYKVVVSIVGKDGSINLDVFDRNERKTLIRKAAKEFNISEKTVIRYFRKYWRCGMNLNAMAPNYENCGSPGRPHNHSEKKIGRKNILEIENGKYEQIYDGETTRMIMYEGLGKFKIPGVPLTVVREKILEVYYCDHWEENEQGVKVPILVDPESRLTYKQLYHFYRQEWKKDPIKWLKSTYGERVYTLSKRALLGNSTLEAYAPGSIYQIDSTQLDINAVLTNDPFHVIGCPTVFVLSDVFSRLVAGFYLTMENPSWISCLLALDNAFNDKVQFCLDYGITISDSDWQSHGLPKMIRADNAEMKSHISDNLVGIKVDISNTAPYRPDWKAIVERRFELINKVVRSLPGGRALPRVRGDSDSRLIACLTPYEITQVLIDVFLYYNNHHLLSEYPRNELLIRDRVPLIPNVLWTWGINNLGGELREEDRDLVMMNLLPQGQASITNAGFLFKGKKYHSGLPEEERLCTISRNNGRTRLPVVYDPRRPDTILCQLRERARYTPLSLSKEFTALRGQHEMEWQEQEIMDHQQSHILAGEDEQAKVALNVAIKAIVEPAQKRTAEVVQKEGKSKHARIANMRENRRKEVDRERREKKLLPDSDNHPEILQIKNQENPPGSRSWYVPRSTHMDLITEIDEETDGHK